MNTREQANRIAALKGVVLPEHEGFTSLWPLLEKIGDEGGVVIIKLDGERDGSNDDRYTLLLSGKHVGRQIRRDVADLEDGVSQLICEYASRCWDIPFLS